ncbi:MAG: PP2C family protein-serine/threonine phosphatase [Spirochaetota bacterium]|nr:PP2C family protein-serine/threonine phosphatase [Spirochaetota bacterium]
MSTLKDDILFYNQKSTDETELLKKVQKVLLPNHPLQINNLNIDYRYVPLEKVGGDYLSFTTFDDGSLGALIGDVSGHGLHAALNLSLIKSSTDEVCRRYGHSPEKYLTELNKLLLKEMPAYFITAIYGFFQFEDPIMNFTFSNGGHPCPIIYRSNERKFIQLDSTGTVVGLLTKVKFESNNVALSRGDRLFLFTDGIPEADNGKREMIGYDENLINLFIKSNKPDISETLDAIMEEINKCSIGKSNMDDITIIGFEV